MILLPFLNTKSDPLSPGTNEVSMHQFGSVPAINNNYLF